VVGGQEEEPFSTARTAQDPEGRDTRVDNMRVEFPYRKEKSLTFGVIFRPVANVILEHEFDQWFYVDSGADITLIPLSVGDLIGLRRLKRNKVQRIMGVGKSSVPIIVKTTSMMIGSMSFRARVAWSQVEEVPPLLGRTDVFRKFSVTFREKEGVTIFKA